MFNPLRIVTPGAIQRGSDEYVGQILAFGALYLTAKVAGKVHDYFTAPIQVAVDNENDLEEILDPDIQSEE